MSCPSCDGTGRIRVGKMATFGLEVRALHVPGDDRAGQYREGGRCRTCDGTGDAPPELPESPGFICQGCGEAHVGEFQRVVGQWVKPAHWFQRTVDGVSNLACSSECIGQIEADTGKRTARMPW